MTMTPITNGQLLAQLQKAIADDPSYADEFSLMDRWDREMFTQYADPPITLEQWLDFLDYCKHETMPWREWFDDWQQSRAGLSID
jgi:hypothetical protein